VRDFERQLRTVFRPSPSVAHLMTLPDVGFTLAVVIVLEVLKK
jgi:hypothetical protein